MKKLIVNLIILIFFLFIFLLIILATTGVETNKFNNFISEKVFQIKKINLELNTIKFKADPKELSLFLETQNPKINYKENLIPAKNIKVYIDFLSLIKSDIKIKKTSISLEEIDIVKLKKLSSIIKPSNFKSLLNNKVKEGKIISEIEIFLNDKGTFKNFIAKGKVKKLRVELLEDFTLKNTSLNFFADQNDILIKNIFGNLNEIKITEGDIKVNLESGLKLNSSFNSKIKFNESLINKYENYFNKYIPEDTIKIFEADLNNNFYIDFDKTYKIKDYKYNIVGKLIKSNFQFTKTFKNFKFKELKNIYFSDMQFKANLSPSNIKLDGKGKYSLNNLDFMEVNFINIFKKDLVNLKLNFDFIDKIEFDIINYKKPKNTVSKLSLDFEKKRDLSRIKEFNFNEGKNMIKIYDLNFNENKLLSFKKIEILTSNNDFSIQNENKITIKGKKFDATNLARFFKKQSKENKFEKLNGAIEIDFAKIKVPMSESLQNFKLIGQIEKGQFAKISSKGDFGGNNFLDISMRKDKNSNKRYLEIYSDLTRPLLTEYDFFKGLSGGKLIFTSVIEDSTSISNLKIENFKVINAPGVIKILSLADLGGLADLARGEGLTFDLLEINMEKNKNFLKLNEILALGPSMSVLMEGYQDKNNLTSLRGTLVPAKTLNKMISKIPVIGKIVIPKEVGEGMFGISFKMKGPAGKIKTTINPIRTITPRFIQKIIDKNKKVK
tara:strand:+ start:3628 stop:5796 length:2169 start_codon:yes stop_codon:yes gene_type:complete